MEFKKISINGVSYGKKERQLIIFKWKCCKYLCFSLIKGEPQSKDDLNYIEDVSSFPKVTNVDFRDQSFFTALRQDTHPENASIK